MKNKNIIIGGLKINYYQSDNFNDKKAIVFLHGWQSEALHLKNIFENTNNWIAFDLPGFGKSDAPKEIWGMGEYAEFLKKILEKLGIKNPILAGHSFGGAVIIKYLAGNGAAARKIILISSAGIRERGFRIYFYKALAKIFKVLFYLPGLSLIKNYVRKFFYKVIDSEDYINAGHLLENYKKIIKEDLREEMKKIAAETVLIWGERDKDVPLKNGELMRMLIPGARFYVIKNAGHFSFVDQPEEFKKVFIKELNYSAI